MLSHPGEPAFPVTRKTHMFTQMWPEPLSKEAETWVFACDVIVPNVKSANQQISKSADQQISKLADQQINQTSKSAYQQISIPANQHTSKSANQSDQQISRPANHADQQTSKSSNQQISQSSRPANQQISQSSRPVKHPSEHLYKYASYRNDAASKAIFWWVSSGSIQFLLKH